MYYTQAITEKLHRLGNRILSSNGNTIENNFHHFWRAIQSDPIFSILIKDAVTEFESEEIETVFDQIMDTAHWFGPFTSHKEEASVMYQFLSVAVKRQYSILSFAMNINYTSNSDFESAIANFHNMIIEPMIFYLSSMIDERSHTLYLLERYKHRVESFTHNQLMTEFSQHKATGEAIFDRDLRLFLFDQGIDQVISQSRTSSGMADVVGKLDSQDPLILEVKYYDDITHTKRNILSGFTQIVKYASDYNKRVGYLVVFNLTQQEIDISSEDSVQNFPSRVRLDNNDYFVISVRLNFEKPASKIGKLQVLTITKEELVNAALKIN